MVNIVKKRMNIMPEYKYNSHVTPFGVHHNDSMPTIDINMPIQIIDT